MEYEKAYVYEPEGQRAAKRRRVEPQGLQASWRLRQEAYRSSWEAQRARIDVRDDRSADYLACFTKTHQGALESINSATTKEISAFLDDALDSSSSRISTGIIVTGPGADTQASVLKQLQRKQDPSARRLVVPLSPSAGTNLKALLKVLIQKATSSHVGVDDEADELQSDRRKGARLLNYDLQLLNDHIYEHKADQVVIAFEDTEAFDSDVLSSLIELLGCWHDRIPFVCLFSIATSVDFLQQRLSREAVKCLHGRLFDVAPAGEELERVCEAITHSESPIWLGSNVMTMALERQRDHIQSVDSFVDAIEYAYMSCFYANALSIFVKPDLRFEEVPKDHYQALRNLNSFQSWAQRSIADGKSLVVQNVLDDDRKLFDVVTRECCVGSLELSHTLHAVDVLRIIQQHLPTIAVSARTDLYVQAMSNKLAGSALIRSLLLTVRRIPSDGAVGLLDAIITFFEREHIDVKGLVALRSELNALLKAQEDAAIPLRSEDDVKNSTLRTTVVAQKVELSKQKSQLSKQDAAYTSILRRITDSMEIFFERALINPKDLLFHEIFLYDLKSPYREVFTPRPRHAIERALASPHDYLDCSCCAPEMDGREEATLASTQPATAVLYQLYLESGSLINASDLWHAFQAVMGDGKEDEQTMTLFQRALAELRYLGLVKSTRKRVDHIAKVAWRGL